MDKDTMVSIAVAIAVMGGVCWFALTKITPSGGSRIMGKGSGKDSTGRK